MKRFQLEHILRAAGDISDDDEIVVVGSQAILGQIPEAPPELLVSMEADEYPKNKPELADLIDGCIGEGSPFEATYGYYAQGVGPNTAVLPRGWDSRLILVRNENTRGVSGWCLEVHDLVLSKYVANRERDRDFITAAIRAGYVNAPELLTRLEAMDLDADNKDRMRARINRDFPGSS